FSVTTEVGTIGFAGNATGEIQFTVDGSNLKFERQGVSDSLADTSLKAIRQISLSDASPFTFKSMSLAFPQFDGEGTGGSPRLWLDYADSVTSAAVKLIDVEDKAAIGIKGTKLQEISISGGFTGADDNGWHQLQIWDGNPSLSTALPAIKTLKLAMT